MAKSQLRVKQLCLLSIISSITNTNGNELGKTVSLTSFQNPQLQYVSSLSTRASLCICSVNTYTYHVLSSYLRKFAPTNQKHFPYLVLAVWNFCSRSPEVISRETIGGVGKLNVSCLVTLELVVQSIGHAQLK